MVTQSKQVPLLKRKRPQDVDPHSLTAALFWDRIADPGDYDASRTDFSASASSATTSATTSHTTRIYVHKLLGEQ